MEEALIIAKWYFGFLGFGIIGLAITLKLFHNWQDRGYGVAKFVGLLTAGIPIWLLSTWHLIPFTQVSALIIFLLLVAVSIYVLWRSKFKVTKFMVIEEIMFLVVYMIWNLIRSTNSMIEGTEKMMNLAIMNSIERTQYFPPQDVWMSGLSINYYYLGHFLFTFVGKFLGIAMSYAYNLSMTTIIAQVFIGTVSILGQMTGLFKKHWKLGLLLGTGVALWLCFGSNLHYMYTWVQQVVFQGKTFTYWFPDGTRIIPNAIDEFPAYSITLADLHGHYMGMPFVTMFIAFLLVSFQVPLSSRKKALMNLCFSFALFFLYGINSWDFITVNFLFVLLHLYQAATMKVAETSKKIAYVSDKGKQRFQIFKLDSTLKTRIIDFLVAEGALLLPGIPLILPFFLAFKPAVSGIGLVPLSTPRELLPYLQMWGAFLIINILGVITLVVLNRIKKKSPLKFIKGLVERNSNAIFASLLTIAALCLIIGVEVFYVRDIFEKSNPTYFRTNTIFKFYFAAWNIWAIASGYVVYAIFRGIFATPWKKAFPYLAMVILIISALFVGTVSYIFQAVKDFYPFLKFKEDNTTFSIQGVLDGKHPTLYGTLDGNDYIKTVSKADKDIIDWFNTNVSGQPVVLEAVGDAYTYSARISTNTGLPTVMGWPTHEWQWRNTTTEIYARKDDVANMYTGTNEDVFVHLIDKYTVDYIVVSDLEKGDYNQNGKTINTDMIKKFYDLVFTSGNGSIYRYKGLSSSGSAPAK